MMDTKLQQFRDHLVNTGIVLGEYAPGKKVNWLADVRESLMSGGWAEYAGQELWEKCKHLQPEVLFGKGYGSAPLLFAMQAAAHRDGVKVSTLLVRDERKNRNRMRLVEGPRPHAGARAVFVDDVINTGAAYRNSCKALKEEKIDVAVVGMAFVYHFWKPSGGLRLEAQGTPVFWLLRRHDLGFSRRDDDQPHAVEPQEVWRALSSNQWHKFYKTRPSIVGDKVYYGTDKHVLFCHDLATGDLLWSHQLHRTTQLKGLGCGLGFDEHNVFLTSYDGTLTSLNKETGQFNWCSRLDLFIHAAPVLDGDFIYLGTEGGIGISGAIQCVRKSDGARVWRVPNGDATPCTAKVIGDLVVCGSNDKKLYAIDKLSGVVRWTVKVGQCKGQVALLGDVIVCSCDNGDLFGVSLAGEIVWHRTAGVVTLHQHLQSDGSRVFLANAHGLVAYDAQGTQLWFRQLRATALWNVTFDGERLIVITETGQLRVLSPSTGHLLQVTNLGYKVRTPCAATQEHLAVASLSKGLFIYKRKPCTE